MGLSTLSNTLFTSGEDNVVDYKSTIDTTISTNHEFAKQIDSLLSTAKGNVRMLYNPHSILGMYICAQTIYDQINVPDSKSLTRWNAEFGTLDTTGATTINNTLTVTSTSTLNALNVTGATTVSGAATIHGTTTLNDTLTVSGATTLTGAASLKDNLTVDGATTLSGATTVSGALTVAGATTLTGAASLKDNLTVSGTTTLTGAASLKDNLTVDGTTTLSGATTVSGALTVAGATTLTGAASLKDNLTVDGATTLSGATTVSGALTVAGATTLTGAASLKDNLTVDGATTLSGATTVSGALSVAGATTLSGATTVSGALSVAGATTLTGAVTGHGTSTLNALNVTGNTNITGNLTTTGQLTVSGASTINNNLDVTGTVDVTGSVTLNSNLTVSGNTTITGTLTVTGDTVLGANSYVGSSVTGNRIVTQRELNTNQEGLHVKPSSYVMIGYDLPTALGTPQTGTSREHTIDGVQTTYNSDRYTLDLSGQDDSGENVGLKIDGVTIVTGDQGKYILINQPNSNKYENGIYVIINGGVDTVNETLTIERIPEADGNPSNDLQVGDYTFVSHGKTHQGGWSCTATPSVPNLTDPIVFDRFSGAGELNVESTDGSVSISTTYDGSIKSYDLSASVGSINIALDGNIAGNKSLPEIFKFIDNNFKVLFQTVSVDGYEFKNFYTTPAVSNNNPSSTDDTT